VCASSASSPSAIRKKNDYFSLSPYNQPQTISVEKLLGDFMDAKAINPMQTEL